MNSFWRIIAILGLLVLTAQAALLFEILSRMPQPLPTVGEYRADSTMQGRTRLANRTPIVRANVILDDDTPIKVQIKEQPVEVRAVR